MYLVVTLLLSSPRSTPSLPTTELPKPTPFIVTLIACLVVHPIALIIGLAWKRTRERQGRIRLEEEVEEAEEAEREAEAEAGHDAAGHRRFGVASGPGVASHHRAHQHSHATATTE
jgi:hypothetical protein